jgi:hypothetical protein
VVPQVRGWPVLPGLSARIAADEAIGSEMSVAADDDVGGGSGEQWPELVIGDVGFDSRAVVGPG